MNHATYGMVWEFTSSLQIPDTTSDIGLGSSHESIMGGALKEVWHIISTKSILYHIAGNFRGIKFSLIDQELFVHKNQIIYYHTLFLIN